MKKNCYLLLIIAFTFSLSGAYAQKGKDGPGTISTSNIIVNEYTTLTADAIAGATSITVSSSALNTNNRFSGPLGNGDLIMIIQMQGATINGTSNDSTWGTITNYNNCGLYEFLEVTGTTGANTININCTLKNNYTATGKTQVIRVKRYSSLAVNNGGSIKAPVWSGTLGGVVAIEVQNNTTIDGAIDVNGLGFRGGALNQEFGGSYTQYNFFTTDISQGGEKGESIAGYETDYNAFGGMFERGAPANGGGGGNAWNCAGGGGANAGDITKWTGNGNPDITTSASYATAWNLEYNGFANSTSTGGGRGGYAVAGATNGVSPDPLVTPPGDPSWSSTFLRNNTGGKGGRPLDYSTGRIFFGGGGGAPHEDDGHITTGGGRGGGIVYLLSNGTITGSGNITANGSAGGDANCGSGNGDPPAGGGGGGAIILNSTGAISGISITANGGKGGDQIINNSGEESEGGAGGGGGGYIALSNGSPARAALGGANGTTNSIPMQTFLPDGATAGGAGIPDATIPPLAFSSLIIDAGPDQTICDGQSAKLNVTGGNAGDTYLWTPSTGLDSTNVVSPVSTPTGTLQYVVTVSNGTCSGKDSMIVTVLPKVDITQSRSDSICPSKSVTLDPGGSLSYNYSWSPSAGLNCTSCSSPIASPSATTTYTVIATNQYCNDTGTRVVKVLPFPTLTASDITVCYGQPTQLNVNTNGTLTWAPPDFLSCTDCNNPEITAFTNTTYTITATLGTCVTTEDLNVTVDEPIVFAGIDTTIFKGSTATLHGSGADQYQWQPSNNLSSYTLQNPVASPSATTTYTLIGSDAFACSAISSVVVFVNDPCEIPVLPNAFSPNDDGENDSYKMINPFVDKLLIFSIYNRWGQLVFETEDLNIGWDGKFNGQPEPVGTYAYYLKVICQGNTLLYKGNVTLIR